MKLPHLTIYTDNLPPNVGGTAQAFVVKIRPKYKDDKGIHDHEYVHVKQWYKAMAAWVAIIALLTIATYDDFGYALAPLAIAGVGLHGLLYLLIPSYRLEAEAEAYAAQTKPDRSDLDLMAYRMSLPSYRLGITQEQAKAEIEEWL
jgi:hypothetical protein